MTTVRLTCERCCSHCVVRITTMNAFVCRDDPALSSYGFDCPTCGPQIQRMHVYEFHALDAAGITTTYWSTSEALADVRAEHMALIKEFSDQLPAVLEQILNEADAA